MARVLAVATAFGLATAFRVDHRRNAAAQEEKLDAPQTPHCSIHGDPHVVTFDVQQRGGPQWHPLYAAGHYWLVKTESDWVSIQATYGECGKKGGGSWMATRLNDRPRTCMTGVGIGGRFMGGKELVVQVPCDWDWDNSKCRTTDTTPRVTYKGERVSAPLKDGSVAVAVQNNIVYIQLPQNIAIHLTMVSFAGGMPWQYTNAKIFMPKGNSAQCGHCGNFDGVPSNDFVYTQTGELKSAKAPAILHHVAQCHQCGIQNFCSSMYWVENFPDVESRYVTGTPLSTWGCDKIDKSAVVVVRNSKSGNIYVVEAGGAKADGGDLKGGFKGGLDDNLCDADVHCNERIIKGDPVCKENEGGGTTFTIEDCPQAIRDRAEEICREKFAELVDPKLAAVMEPEVNEEQLKACVMDACLDEGFADDDAKDAEEEDLADLKGLKGMGFM